MAVKDPTLRTIYTTDADAMKKEALALLRNGYKCIHVGLVSIEVAKGNEIVAIRIEQKI